MWHSPRAQLKFAYALTCLVIGLELVTWCDRQLVIGRTHRLHLDLSCQLFCLDNVGALRLIQEAVVLIQVILRRKQEKFHFHFLYYVIWIKLRKWKIRNHEIITCWVKKLKQIFYMVRSLAVRAAARIYLNLNVWQSYRVESLMHLHYS